jgi:outer membrane biosynthesis protein TonB
MRAKLRIVLLTALAALAPVLSACTDFDLDKLDVFGLSEKKKLPGERKELFPEGVPGVTQGIPPEYMKGNQQSLDAALAQPAGQQGSPASAEPDKKTAAVEPEPKPKPKRKPKPKAAARAPAPSAPQSAEQQQQPAPWPQQAAPQQAQAPQLAPWPTQGQGAPAAPWPSSPAPGASR